MKTVRGNFEPDVPYAEIDAQLPNLGANQGAGNADWSLASLQHRQRLDREEEKLALVVEVLNFADVTAVELDGELIAFLPFHDLMTLGGVIDILGGLPANLSTELAFLTEYHSSQRPTAVNLSTADFIRLKPKQTLHFITEATYRDSLGSYYRYVAVDAAAQKIW